VLARLGQVENARVRTHEHVGGMQSALEELGAGFGHVNAAEGRFRQGIGGHE